MADTVELTDLEVISRYSLAVRAATAERADLVEALRADLAWLEGGRRSSAVPARPAAVKKAGAAKKTATKTAAKTATKRPTRRS